MFVQSGGCCAGSTPMCFPAGEFLIGDIDVLLGDIDGCPFYIDKRLDQAWHQEQFLLDVAPGEPEDFSLPAGDNLHFVTRSPACVPPGVPAVDQRFSLQAAARSSSGTRQASRSDPRVTRCPGSCSMAVGSDDLALIAVFVPEHKNAITGAASSLLSSFQGAG
jgi:uncharacterized protein (DUF779 family)